MLELAVDLCGSHPATLLYLAEYTTVRDSPLAWLLLRKRKGQRLEKLYRKALPDLIATFVGELTAHPMFPPDLLLIPPSATRHFVPYLKALMAASPRLVVVDGIFTRADRFGAARNSRPFNHVAGLVRFIMDEPPCQIRGARQIMILDDFYCTGVTAGAVFRRVRPLLATDPQVVIACPLYVQPSEAIEETDPGDAGDGPVTPPASASGA